MVRHISTFCHDAVKKWNSLLSLVGLIMLRGNMVRHVSTFCHDTVKKWNSLLSLVG